MKRPNYRAMLTKYLRYWYERPKSDYYFELHEWYEVAIRTMERLKLFKVDWTAFDKVFA